MAYKLSPPPRPPRLTDPDTQRYLQDVHIWLDDFYRKLGSASDTAPISVTGTAATITGAIAPTQLSGAVPVALGGTGATTAGSAAANLGVQSAFSPGASGDVPISDGVTFATRRLAYNDVDGVKLTQTKRGVALTAASGALVGDFGDTTVTWATPFADSNYSLFVQVNATAGDPQLKILTKTATDCSIRITNRTAIQSTGTADLTGIHD